MRKQKGKTVQKPWGKEIWFCEEPEYAGKILEIEKGKRSSYHYHVEKKETLYICRGKLKVITEKGEKIVKKGEALTINPGEKHRHVPLEDVKIVEVSTPQLEDVERIEDDYER